MAPTLQKYLFDMDFDAPEKPVEEEESFYEGQDDDDLLLPEPVIIDDVPPPPPPPTFSEEDLQLAREQAYEQGRMRGQQDAEAASSRMLSLAMTSLSDAMMQVKSNHAIALDHHLRDSVAVAVTVVKKMLPETSRNHSLDEIEGVVREALAQLDQDVRVTIRVAPTQLDGVRDHAQRAADACGFEGKLIFAPDARLGLGDCRVEWGDGGAERDEASIWAEIEQIIARALSAPVGPEPTQQQPAPHHPAPSAAVEGEQ